MLNYDNYGQIAQDIAEAINADLEENSFMTTDLALNDKQKDILKQDVTQIVHKVLSVYIANINEHDRSHYISDIVQNNLRSIIGEAFKKVAYEINRGTLINANAVACDAKNDEFNKLELRYSKMAVDVAIPTQGVFISTNCIEELKESIKVDFDNLENKEDELEVAEEKEQEEKIAMSISHKKKNKKA